jgi:hypothetical protein
MIELKVEEYCHNCGAFQPEKQTRECSYTTDDNRSLTIYEVCVVCTREKLCAGLVRYLKKELTKENVSK